MFVKVQSGHQHFIECNFFIHNIADKSSFGVKQLSLSLPNGSGCTPKFHGKLIYTMNIGYVITILLV